MAEDIEGFARFYRIVYRSNTHDVQSNEMVAWKKKAGSYRGIPVVVVKSMWLKACCLKSELPFDSTLKVCYSK